jgi:hypothetical protein
VAEAARLLGLGHTATRKLLARGVLQRVDRPGACSGARRDSVTYVTRESVLAEKERREKPRVRQFERSPYPDLWRQAEAAQVLGLSQPTVIRLLNEGVLDRVERNGVPYVTRASVLVEKDRREAPSRDDLILVSEAAQVLGLSKSAVMTRVRKRVIEPVERGGVVYLTRASVLAERDRREVPSGAAHIAAPLAQYFMLRKQAAASEDAGSSVEAACFAKQAAAVLDQLYAISVPELDELDLGRGVKLAVAQLLSRYICDTRDEAGGHVYQLNALLHGYAHAPGMAGGEHYPPPHPDLASAPCRSGSTAMGRKGLDCGFADFKQLLWEGARERLWRDAAYLPFAVICEFVKARLWLVVATFVEDGPLLAKDRCENHLRAYGRRAGGGDKSSVGVPGARIGSQAVIRRMTAAQKLMYNAVELRFVHRELLALWDAVPQNWDDIEELPRNRRNNVAVPLHTARCVWKALNNAIGGKLNVSPFDFDAQWAAVDLLRKDQLFEGGHFRLWRRRLSFALQYGLGCRKGAALRISREDYAPARPRRDGTIGPAVRLYERKRSGRYVEAWKPIPHELGQLIELSIYFFDRYLTEVTGLGEVPSNLPLICGTDGRRRHDGTAYGKAAFTTLFSGGKTGRGDIIQAMVPREGSPQWAGHPPHHLRSTARFELTTKSSKKYFEDRGVDVKPAWIAETLLGHASEDIEKLYGGAAKDEDREHLARFATERLWVLLTTHAGARTKLNLGGYRDAARALKAHQDEIERIELEVAGFEANQRHLMERRTRARQRGDHDRVYELQDELDRTQSCLRKGERELTRLTRLTAEVRDDLRELRQSRTRRVLVDDAVPAVEVPAPDPAKFDEIDREVFEGVTTHRSRRRAQRLYISLHEFATGDGRSPDFFKDLLAGKWPKKMRGVEPWKRGENPLTDWSTRNRRAFLVERLNPDLPLLTDPDKRAWLDELLATNPYPDGWGAEYLGYALPWAQRRHNTD